MTTLTGLAGAAVELAARGYHVFPCKPRDKRPLTAHGFKEATRDERKILHWWDSHPDANIGIACGASGVAVLDIDTKHGANPNEILGGHVEPGLTIVQTGTAPPRDASHPRSLEGARGAQVYFRGQLRTGDTTIPGVEIRGTGAYVIAPPSIHPSGVAYGPSLPLPVTSLLDVPGWVTDILDTATNGHGPAVPIADTIPKGEQHKTLVSLAGTMRRRGMNADAIEAALLVINDQQLEEPAPRENIREIARSVAKYHPERAVAGADAIARGNEQYIVEITDKGIKLPPPADGKDFTGHCAWLTAVFALDANHPIVGGERQGGRGADGHVVLTRRGASPLRFEPASRINTPAKISEDLAWQTLPTDDAVPAFKGEHCRQIAHVIRMLCGIVDAWEAAQETEGIIGSYLSSAVIVEGFTTYGDSRDRYAAAAALRRDQDDRGYDSGPVKYLIDSNTGELVIPYDELTSTARKYLGGSVARGWLEARMKDLGWERRLLDGHGAFGENGRQGHHLKRVVYRGHLRPPVEGEQAA